MISCPAHQVTLDELRLNIRNGMKGRSMSRKLHEVTLLSVMLFLVGITFSQSGGHNEVGKLSRFKLSQKNSVTPVQQPYFVYLVPVLYLKQATAIPSPTSEATLTPELPPDHTPQPTLAVTNTPAPTSDATLTPELPPDYTPQPTPAVTNTPEPPDPTSNATFTPEPP